MLQKMGLAVIINLLSIIFICGQSEIPLEQILNETEKQAANYQETFKNLLAVETKTFEEYDKNGDAKNKKTVESNFLVYQSSKNNKISFELRDVIKVDGKPVPNGQASSDAFFAELNKATTLKSELEKIQKTSSKYDKTLDVSGLTLYESIMLSPNLRSSFEFNLVGKDNFQGNDVYVVSYLQTKQNPNISFDGKGTDPNTPSLNFGLDIPGDLKKNDVFLRGKLWIDAGTFQIWREERELVAQSSDLLVILSTNFEYQPSTYGILVPKQIDLLSNEVKKKDGKFTAIKDARIVFDYSQFRKTETDVKILDDTEN